MRDWPAGILLGAGGFQLYDGLVQHLIFHLHQIRYGVDTLPYNLIWNVLAGMMVIIGGLLLRRGVPGRRAPRRSSAEMAAWDNTAASASLALLGLLYAGGRLRLYRRGISWPVGREAASQLGCRVSPRRSCLRWPPTTSSSRSM